MRRSTIATALALATLPAVLRADNAACNLFVSSYSDSIVNGSTGEDADFFVSTGGVPNLMFLLDTSGSMRRLPPDGASGGWGSFQDAAHVSGSATGYGCVNTYANALVFHSACGTLSKEGQSYSTSTDWANEKDSAGSYCPYMVAGNQPPATDRRGFDPDFYLDANGSPPIFFSKDKVFHDSVLYYSVSGYGSANADGWDDWHTYPQSDTNASAFCTRVGGADATKVSSCNTCMTSQGYWFAGNYKSDADFADMHGSPPSCTSTSQCAAHGYGMCVTDASPQVEYSGSGTAHCRIPNVWFTGNFLNFYPPKFIIARKVLKDVLQAVRKVRLGLTVLSVPNGSTLLDGINPGCSLIGSPANFDSNRTSILNAINNSNQVTFNGGTPLAERLLNIGQLYTTRSLPWFNSTYQNSNFRDAVSTSNNKSVCYACQQSSVLIITDGIPTTDGTIPGTDFAANPMTTAASNTAGVYTGGAGYNITGIGCQDCPECNTAAEAADTSIANGDCTGQQASGACDEDNNPIQAYLPKVAWYLHNVDSRVDTETAYDNFKMTGKQTTATYTIGLGTSGNAAQILEHTADAGGGTYNGGLDTPVVDASTLRTAIMKVLESVNSRSTSFGAAAISPLQAAASQGVVIPRFEPTSAAHWNGHLYEYRLYSEFASGNSPISGFVPCFIPTSGASGPANGDYDCDGQCNSVFLMDADNHLIMENGAGQFVVNSPPTRAACGFGNLCSDCATASTTLARPVWDAGDKLAAVDFTASPPAPKSSGFTKWSDRKIFTVIDSNGDGKLTKDDALLQLDGSDGQADQLTPYLNIKGSSFCAELASRLVKVGNPVGTTIRTELTQSPKKYTSCAKTILQYLRGADIFNELAGSSSATSACNASGGGNTTPVCATWPTTYCTRPYQLGDVFHSSPVEVHAPLASDGILCDTGFDPQCVASLYKTATPGPSTASPAHANAYDDYAKSDRYHRRSKFVLAGANDGLLHAIHTGTWNATAKQYDDGDGSELWAFVPPDLLAKMPLFLGNLHQFFVDATPMVRDVWIDGYQNGLSGSPSRTGVKEGSEFHTVAVVGERRGGTHYFALDVTDAGLKAGDGTALNLAPKFLWVYPQPTDPEQLSFGETYADFTPSPPPIGPVRIDNGDAASCATGMPTYDGGDGARCFKEQWVAFLAGGFDPQYTKGRGVHMVDIYTGAEIFDFSQPFQAASSCVATSDPRCHLNYPIASTVAMMAWGRNANFAGNDPNGYFFDTATFGDTGGQTWVIRFNAPGQLTDGKVTNWFGARIFQQDKAGALTCGLDFCGTQPFFHITANVPLAVNGLYRVLLGTGDRYNLLDPSGGQCSADNLRACVIKGCTVTLDDGSGGNGAVFGTSALGTQGYHMNHPGLCSGETASSYSTSTTSAPGGNCTSVTAKVKQLSISCPSTASCSGNAETTSKTTSVTCTIDSTTGAESCQPTALSTSGIPIDTKGDPDKKNWFFSMLVFNPSGDRQIFRTAAQALAYDAARLTDTDLVQVNDHDANASNPLADPNGNGWRYFFDHGEPNPAPADSVTINGSTFHIYRTDERVASTTGVGAGCAFWNTMQAAIPPDSVNAATECPINSPCKAGKSQVAYLYGAVPSTGDKCLVVNNYTYRSQQSATLVPPHMGKLIAYLSKNQVSFGLTTVRIPQGGQNISLGRPQDISALQRWLPVDKATHDCRHGDKNGAAPAGCPQGAVTP